MCVCDLKASREVNSIHIPTVCVFFCVCIVFVYNLQVVYKKIGLLGVDERNGKETSNF